MEKQIFLITEAELETQILQEMQQSKVQEWTAEEIVKDLKITQMNFCPDMPIQEIWQAEKQCYIQHGMSAFDCGYTGKQVDWSLNK